MKKNSYIIVLLITIISLGSCQKALIEEPKNFLNPEQFFKTDDDAKQGVNGVYFWLVGSHPQRLFQQELWSYLDEECDNILGKTVKGALDISPLNPGPYTQTMWNGCYRGVYNASQLIDKVPKSGTSTIKDRSVAEARFLRALYYYYLTGIFRDVPLITDKNYLDIEVTRTLPRTPAADVRKLMIEDLNAAIAVLPLKYSDAADKGRATKGAAQTLLTKVYLWNKDWKNAVTTAKAIQGYRLLDNYADVFKSDNEFNDESIFEIDFKTDLLNSYQHAFYAPNKTVNVEPFTSKPWYGGYVPFKAFADSFEANDARKESIIATGYNGKAFTPETVYNTDVWFGPKWWRLDAGERNSGLDIYVFRYADVLLMLAEAANEDNDITTALDAINQVRVRGKITPLAGLTQDALRTAIRKERSIELVGEGHRKFDLVRWGIWLETAKAAMATEAPLRANSLQKKYEYAPIPAGEVQKDPALNPQNEGY
jgi:hypothetical protein